MDDNNNLLTSTARNTETKLIVLNLKDNKLQYLTTGVFTVINSLFLNNKMPCDTSAWYYSDSWRGVSIHMDHAHELSDNLYAYMMLSVSVEIFETLDSVGRAVGKDLLYLYPFPVTKTHKDRYTLWDWFLNDALWELHVDTPIKYLN